MKKTILWAILALLLPVTQAWGGGTPASYYYAKMKADGGTGCGKVYVSTSATSSPDYKESEHTVQQGGQDKKNTGYTFYLYAQHKYGYKFVKWDNLTTIDDQNQSVTDAAFLNNTQTTENGCQVKVTTGAKSFGNSGGTENTTATATAVYEPYGESDPKYTLTLGNEEGTGAYSVTAAVDFPAVAAGGSVTVYPNDGVKISVTPAHGYDFQKWKCEIGSETTYSTDAAITISSFSSDAKISAIFKKQVEVFATCLGSEGGTYKANGTAIGSTDQKVSDFAQVTVALSDPKENPGYEFVGWYRPYGNGAKEYVSYYTSASVTERSDFTIGADFRKLNDNKLVFESPVDGEYTATIDSDEAFAVDSENVTVTKVGACTVALSATGYNANKVPKWYTKAETGDKVYFAIGAKAETKISDSSWIGVDFIQENVALLDAIDQAQKNGGTCTLTNNVYVAVGTTCTIPKDVTINLGGYTNYVDGTLVVNGVLEGDGVLSTGYKLIRQTGNGLQPISSGDIKYWKTTSESLTGSVTGNAAATKTHVTMVNGYGKTFHAILKNANPEGILCYIDTTDGVKNTINGYWMDSTTIANSTKESGLLWFNYQNLSKTLIVQLADSITLTQSHFPSGMRYTQTKNGVSTEDSSKAKCNLRYDVAGKTLKINYNDSGSTQVDFINGTVQRESSQLQSAWETFINCQNVKQRYKNSAKTFFYDCTVSSMSVEGTRSSPYGVHYCSGGPYDVTKGTASENYVYAGVSVKSTSCPAKERILASLQGTHEFFQHADGNWYLEPIQNPRVAEINGEKKVTLDEAIAVALEDQTIKSTITFLRNFTVENPVTIPAGLKLRLELNGCQIEAPNGFVKNSGELEIGDKYGNLSSSGIYCGNANVFENKNGGTIEIAYGKYQGTIVLEGGSLFTTHHGSFPGTISVAGNVVDPKSVANIRGGVFSADVGSLLKDGFIQTNGYVGQFPYAYLEKVGITGYDVGYHIVAMSPADKALYCNGKTVRENGTLVDDWYRRAELYSQYEPFLGYSIDCVLKFDADVAAKSVAAYGKTSVPLSMDLENAVAKGQDCRVLSGMVAANSYYQISYSRFISDSDVNDITCAVGNKSDANVGTTCKIRLDLCHGANKYDVSKLTSAYTIAERSVVLGAGDNEAMIVGSSPVVFDTFANCLSAVEEGGTIRLCNDVAGESAIAIGAVCTIDLNGFKAAGGLVAANQFKCNVDGDVYTFERDGAVIGVPVIPGMTAEVYIGGEKQELKESYFVIAGTTFKVVYSTPDPTKYIGGTVTKEFVADKSLTVTLTDDEKAKEIVAKIGGKPYASLKEAIIAAKEGDTIKAVKVGLSSATVDWLDEKARFLTFDGEAVKLTVAVGVDLEVMGGTVVLASLADGAVELKEGTDVEIVWPVAEAAKDAVFVTGGQYACDKSRLESFLGGDNLVVTEGDAGKWLVGVRVEIGSTTKIVSIGTPTSTVDEEKVAEVIGNIEATDEEKASLVADINSKTTVDGVKLTNVDTSDVSSLSAEAVKTNGVQAVVRAAQTVARQTIETSKPEAEQSDEEKAASEQAAAFQDAVEKLDAATTTNSVLSVKVEVTAKLVDYVPPTKDVAEGSGEGTIKFELKPEATVSVKINDGVPVSQKVDVSNDMIDKAQSITVSMPSRFRPVQVLHRDNDGFLIEEFTGEAITYANGIVTVRISHFSSMELKQAPVDPLQPVGTVKIGNGFYQDTDKYGTATNFFITSIEGFKLFRDIVNGGFVDDEKYSATLRGTYTYQNNIFSGKTVRLLCDVDLNGEDFEPIGNSGTVEGVAANPDKQLFYGSFDAGVYEGDKLVGRHVIKNLVCQRDSIANRKLYSVGLFGILASKAPATIKNLVIENVDLKGADNVGAIVGNAKSSGVTIENCTLKGAVSIYGTYAYAACVGGFAGNMKGTVRNCTVEGTGTVKTEGNDVGGIVGQQTSGAGVIVGCSVSGISVSAKKGYAGGIAGRVRSEISGCEAQAVVTTEEGPSGAVIGAVDGAGVRVLENTPKSAGQCGGVSDDTVVGWEVVGTLADGEVTGGTFEALPDTYVAAGYAKFVQGTTPETYKVLPVVASIAANETVYKFATLQSAIDAVQAGQTVVVLANNDETITVTNSCAFTFDANGHTLGETAPTVPTGWEFVKNGGVCTYQKCYTYEGGVLKYGNVALTEAEVAAFAGVNVNGVRGFDTKVFATIQEAYEALSSVVVSAVAKVVPPYSDDATVNATFSDVTAEKKINLSWNVWGSQTLPTGYVLSCGREQGFFGSYWMDRISVYGKNAAAKVKASTITVPWSYQYSETNPLENVTLTISNLTLEDSDANGLAIARNGIGLGGTFTFTLTNCTVNGGFNMAGSYQGNSVWNITDNTFTCREGGYTTYPLFLNGVPADHLADRNTVLNFTGNTVSGYVRALNFNAADGTLVVTGNTITPGAGYSAVQVSNCGTAEISGNTIHLNGGNVLTLHENLYGQTAAISVHDNVIDGTGYAVYDDVNAENKTYGPSGANVTLTWTGNSVASGASMDTKKGIKGASEKSLSSYVYGVLNPVAKIGSQTYKTLAAAIADAANDKTRSESNRVTIDIIGECESVSTSADLQYVTFKGHEGGSMNGFQAATNCKLKGAHFEDIVFMPTTGFQIQACNDTDDSDVVISGCTFNGNHTSTTPAIQIQRYETTVVSGLKILNNTFAGYDNGSVSAVTVNLGVNPKVSYDNNVVVSGNRFKDIGFNAVQILKVDGLVLDGNAVTNAQSWAVLNVSNSTNVEIDNNKVQLIQTPKYPSYPTQALIGNARGHITIGSGNVIGTVGGEALTDPVAIIQNDQASGIDPYYNDQVVFITDTTVKNAQGKITGGVIMASAANVNSRVADGLDVNFLTNATISGLIYVKDVANKVVELAAENVSGTIVVPADRTFTVKGDVTFTAGAKIYLPLIQDSAEFTAWKTANVPQGQENNVTVYGIAAQITVGETVTNYYTLQEAINAVKADQTVTVLANNDETITVTNTCAFTLNANGHTLSATAPTVPADWKFVKNGDVCSYVAKVYVARIGTVKFETFDAAMRAASTNLTGTAENPVVVQLYPGVVMEGGYSPDGYSLTYVTIQGADGDFKSCLKDCYWQCQGASTYYWKGVTFKNIEWNNSRLSLTTFKSEDIVFDGNYFHDLTDVGSISGVHVSNVNAKMKNFTYCNNVFDNSLSGSVAAMNFSAGCLSGNINIISNTVKNSSWRSFQVQFDASDGIADNFVITDNLISGNASAPQFIPCGDKTDDVSFTFQYNLSECTANVSMLILNGFNLEKTTLALDHNYFSKNPRDYPGKFYVNGSATSYTQTAAWNLFPFYNSYDADVLASDGVRASLRNLTAAPTTICVSAEGNDDTGDGTEEKPFATIAKALTAANSGDTVKLLTGLAGNLAAEKSLKLDLNGNTLTGSVSVTTGSLVLNGAGTITGTVTGATVADGFLMSKFQQSPGQDAKSFVEPQVIRVLAVADVAVRLTDANSQLYYFKSLGEAANSFIRGGSPYTCPITLTMLKDNHGFGLKFVQKCGPIMVDFAGFTYTVDETPLAGSAGTESQAMQVIKYMDITLKNGTLVAAHENIKDMIRSYAHSLTLDNMTIDGSQMTSSGARYTLYCNSDEDGSVTHLTNNTKIVSRDDLVSVYVEYDGKKQNVCFDGDTVQANTVVKYADASSIPSLLATEKIVKPTGLAGLVIPENCEWTAFEEGKQFLDYKKAAQITVGETTTKYYTLQAAIDAVQAGQTVVVLANNDETITVTNTCAFTLDANGHSLSATPPAVPEGWQFVKNDNVCSYVAVTYVAQIGSRKFETFAEAIEAANATGGNAVVVELLADCEVPAAYTDANPLALIRSNVEINLAGKTLTVANAGGFKIDGSEVIVDSRAGETVVSNAAVACAAGTGLRVTGNNVTAMDIAIAGGVYVDGERGNIWLTDCVVTAVDGDSAIHTEGAGIVTVAGGSVTGGLDAFGGLIEVRSGTFAQWTPEAGANNLSIVGGTFDSDPTAKLVTPYKATAQGAVWKVAPDSKYVAKIVGQDLQVIDWYTNLTEAVDEILDGTVGVIVLLRDVTEAEIPPHCTVRKYDNGDQTLEIHLYIGEEAGEHYETLEQAAEALAGHPEKSIKLTNWVPGSQELPTHTRVIHNGNNYELTLKIYYIVAGKEYATRKEAADALLSAPEGTKWEVYNYTDEQFSEDTSMTDEEVNNDFEKVLNGDHYEFTRKIYVCHIGTTGYTSFTKAVEAIEAHTAEGDIVVDSKYAAADVPAGWKMVQNGETFTLKKCVYVCEIDGAKYETLEEAIAALGAGEASGTIEVYEDYVESLKAPHGWEIIAQGERHVLRMFVGDATVVTVKEYDTRLDHEALTNLISDLYVVGKVEELTAVGAVRLTNLAETNAQGAVISESGVFQVINKVAEKGGESFSNALATASNICIKVDVVVTPTVWTNSSDVTLTGTFKYDLTPEATVSLVTDGVTNFTEKVDVTNDMIDKTRGIPVSVYAGFNPALVLHRDDDGTVIESFSGDAIRYDASTGTVTVVVTHFSTVEGDQKGAVAKVTKDEASIEYNSLAEALAAADGGSVLLLQDMELVNAVTNTGNDVTFDFNGHTISWYEASSGADKTKGLLVNTGTMTLTESTDEGGLDAGSGLVFTSTHGDEAKTTITGGSYVGNFPTSSIGNNIEVRRGVYSSDPANFMAPGYYVVPDGPNRYLTEEDPMILGSLTAASLYPWGAADLSFSITNKSEVTLEVFDGEEKIDPSEFKVVATNGAVTAFNGKIAGNAALQYMHLVWTNVPVRTVEFTVRATALSGRTMERTRSVDLEGVSPFEANSSEKLWLPNYRNIRADSISLTLNGEPVSGITPTTDCYVWNTTSLQPGTYVFDLTANEIHETATFTIKLLAEGEGGMVDVDNEKMRKAGETQDLLLPAAWGETAAGYVTISVTNAYGDVVMSDSVPGSTRQWTFATTDLEPGTYGVVMGWNNGKQQTAVTAYAIEILAEAEWGVIVIDNTRKAIAAATEQDLPLPASWGEQVAGSVTVTVTNALGETVAVATVPGGTEKWTLNTDAFEPGTYGVTMSWGDQSVTATYGIAILAEAEWGTIVIDNVVKIHKADETQDLPMPAAWDDSIVGNVLVEVLDADGNVVASDSVSPSADKWTLNTGDLEPGTYRVRISWTNASGDKKETANFYVDILAEAEWGTIVIDNRIKKDTVLPAADSQELPTPYAWGDEPTGSVTITLNGPEGYSSASTVEAGADKWTLKTGPLMPGVYEVVMSWTDAAGSHTETVKYRVDVLAQAEWGYLEVDNLIKNRTRQAKDAESIALPASWGETVSGDVTITLTDADGVVTTKTVSGTDQSWEWNTVPVMPGAWGVSISWKNGTTGDTNVTYTITGLAEDAASGLALDNLYEEEDAKIRHATNHVLSFNLQWTNSTFQALTMDGKSVAATPDAAGVWEWNTNGLLTAVYTFTNKVYEAGQYTYHEAKFRLEVPIQEVWVYFGGETNLLVSTDWYKENVGELEEKGAMSDKMKEAAANGHAFWKNYVMGWSPTNANERLLVRLTAFDPATGELTAKVEGMKLEPTDLGDVTLKYVLKESTGHKTGFVQVGDAKEKEDKASTTVTFPGVPFGTGAQKYYRASVILEPAAGK